MKKKMWGWLISNCIITAERIFRGNSSHASQFIFVKLLPVSLLTLEGRELRHSCCFVDFPCDIANTPYTTKDYFLAKC